MLESVGFPPSTWSALESEQLEPAAKGLDALTLLELGKAMDLQSPRAFAVWLLELSFNARKTTAELAHHAELVRLNQGLTDSTKTTGTEP